MLWFRCHVLLACPSAWVSSGHSGFLLQQVTLTWHWIEVSVRFPEMCVCIPHLAPVLQGYSPDLFPLGPGFKHLKQKLDQIS